MTTETIFMVLILLVIAVLLTVLVGMSIATKKQLDDVCDEVERIKAKNEIIDPMLIRLDLLKQIDEKYSDENLPNYPHDSPIVKNN